MQKFKHYITVAFLTTFSFFILSALQSCHEKKQVSFTDSPTNGTIDISVDESFRPVIEEQIKMYEASFPGTSIVAHYKTEAECLKDLFKDSATRMVMVTRGLSEKEEQYFKDMNFFIPRYDELASDAIVVLVNARSKDSMFSFQQLKELLTGESALHKTIVFDGLNQTSTARFAIDSILNGQHFDTSVVRAVKNSQEVINYVSDNPDAIGFVGFSWIGNPEDTAQVNMLKKTKIAYVQGKNKGDSLYIKPNQMSIMTNHYPLVRGLYYILKENFAGLGSGFVNFLQYERGQLIFRRAYLGPVKMGFAIRDVRLKAPVKKE